MKFSGKILVIGYGGVARCTLPLLLKHVKVDPSRVTVIDFDPSVNYQRVLEAGASFVREKIKRETMGAQLAKHVGKGDMIIDLAWNIGCNDILQWCHDRDVMYINTSVEMWDPYEDADIKAPTERTLYVRHMAMRKMIAGWKNKKGATAVLDHGANPGLVSHFTKLALEQMAARWLEDNTKGDARRDLIMDALEKHAWNHLAMNLGVKVIHVSERDTQISEKPRKVDEFVNTWSIEGFYEEGTSPAELGWGTHERTLPPRAHVHRTGPVNQICLANYGCRTWVRSWVPAGEILGMVIRHGEAFSMSEYLTVMDGEEAIYRPTVHYAYCPCDAAIASLHELHMRNFQLQPHLRIMSDEIVDGQDQLGCLLMGHDYKSWWIGSVLDIHQARQLVPHQNATTIQVACSVIAATLWMIANPHKGVCLPDHLPHEFILKHAAPYLGPLISQPVDWTPLKNWDRAFSNYGLPKPSPDDVWQFNTYLARLG